MYQLLTCSRLLSESASIELKGSSIITISPPRRLVARRHGVAPEPAVRPAPPHCYVSRAPAPYDSGDTKHDQGINKAGNTRARVIAVQMAWLWLRYQSKSELSLWYYRRVGDLKGRVRRIMIIALARKLVIALWRYVETGKVPTGAIVTA